MESKRRSRMIGGVPARCRAGGIESNPRRSRCAVSLERGRRGRPRGLSTRRQREEIAHAGGAVRRMTAATSVAKPIASLNHRSWRRRRSRKSRKGPRSWRASATARTSSCTPRLAGRGLAGTSIFVGGGRSSNGSSGLGRVTAGRICRYSVRRRIEFSARGQREESQDV